MSNQISVNPDKLDELANSFVAKLSEIEAEYKQLHLELANLIMSAPAEYQHCFYQVGDTWSTGNALVDYLSNLEFDIRSSANKFAEADNLIGKLYKLHENYGAITALGALSARQAAYYGIGLTKFMKNADDVYSFRHMGVLNALSDVIDNSKFKKIARGYLRFSFISKKYNGYSFADLLHKKYAKYLPGEAVDFTNDSRSLYRKIKNSSVDTDTLKSFGKSAWKFAKVNGPITFAVTAGASGVGMGLKISENYAKYGNNPEVLKRENAKAVGTAVNDTFVIGGASIAGAVVGGALGSLVGPVGTVVGSAAGSFIGGVIGEKVAKFTAPYAEKAAIAFKEPIHTVVSGLKSGFEKAGKAVDVFNTGVEYANKQIKETLGDPIGKAKEIGEGFSKAKDTAKSLLGGAANFVKGKFSFG
ncbi:hypothetical protein M4D55_21150 [Metabacillus idriensis]|uniref:Glycine zipper domain-containing protein n=1 Tax=Metabacillus idriensis TaxID=324768 RepID=A0A6I2MCT1_9BACI|nr:hypothetical protein [Metabacillus idriensis]MCM3598270.1 hypothetical protein [Metabacillus idriensis]MRX55107.1 hypothetical protein [Metabacillus idriensis]OHR71826.1 hypothetical protein HMPREF3291_23635 [Bacillus sp. HMSC76G11]